MGINYSDGLLRYDFISGKYPPQLSGNNGNIVLRFTGDDCKNDKDYSLSVIMQCDYSESDTIPVLFPFVSIQV